MTTPLPGTPPATLADVVRCCDDVMAHAWMVRTFVKHSEEVEDYPELDGLMGLVRTVFDTSRALETRRDDPPAYLHMLRKKIGRLKSAAAAFETDARQVSVHTNFQMAIRSINVCVRDLEALLAAAASLAASASGTGPSAEPRDVSEVGPGPESSDPAGGDEP